MLGTLTVRTEPVRLRGWVAIAVGAGVMIAVGLLIDPSSWRVVVAGAIITTASQVGGIEWARRGAWSPATVDKVVAAAWQEGNGGAAPPRVEDLLEVVTDGTGR